MPIELINELVTLMAQYNGSKTHGLKWVSTRAVAILERYGWEQPQSSSGTQMSITVNHDGGRIQRLMISEEDCV